MPTGRWQITVASLISGMILGVTLGFYTPVLLALMRGDNPLHVGRYGDWIIRLMVLLPVLVGGLFGFLAWRGRWLMGLRVARWLAILVLCWQVFLMLT